MITSTKPSRYVFAGAIFAIVVIWRLLTYRNGVSTPSWRSSSKAKPHPIDALIAEADQHYEHVWNTQSYDIHTAAEAYRERRGRHPPPGFDAWFSFAQKNDAIIVEEFFDQIHHDLNPFWGLAPERIRGDARKFEMTINVKNGKASAGSDWFWTKIWLELVKTIETDLPDMDLALNAMDEPRLVVPWEEINEYVQAELSSRQLLPPNEMIQSYTHAPNKKEDGQETDKGWETVKPYWKLAVNTCPPDSRARQAEIATDFTGRPSITLDHASAHMSSGFVSNFTKSVELCHQPDIQTMHGALIEPLSVKASKVLFPLFGGSKLAVNNEILIPAPMYWNREDRFFGDTSQELSWAKKDPKIVWRGVATGGKNRESNWRGFQRHRFIAMVNATQVELATRGMEEPQNWQLPPASQYPLEARDNNALPAWVASWTDAAFTDLSCEPPEKGGTCEYTNPYFMVVRGMPLTAQLTSKYLPDIDGNSFSGRYLGFLESGSLPIKSTLFREWHDSRLIPWVHFVPMDNRFLDFWGLMDYFLQRDEAAEKIANAGRKWAKLTLRKEDMQIYTLRLLLEYARVSADQRDILGFVQDLL
ncbi:MAG: hypothetical protein M1828_000100 [Chrysothrix sp. TS-e1954]|nr:MAG: hypothetical protein M1828_000100 [Chrysothrix sp. TS-e1954]